MGGQIPHEDWQDSHATQQADREAGKLMPHNKALLRMGWHLIKRDPVDVTSKYCHCTVCGGAADWLWRYRDDHRE
jgi:hypothetical protein